MIKNKIFKYFFYEYLKLFFLISISLSILIWMTQAARLLELVTEFGNPVQVYIKYILLIYPKVYDNMFLLTFLITMFFLIAKLENSKELEIYFLSGISKKKIINLSISISFITLFFYLILSTFLAPWLSLKGREVLSNSKFSIINSLVKENNFNSPLKGLMIYVKKNDKKGNLENIFIYEKNRTITAKRGEVLSNGNETYLQLKEGTTYELNNNNLNLINFESTIFDFSRFEMQNTVYPKFSERSIAWLINSLKSNMEKKNEIREEINKRLIKPFFILILSVLSCFLFYSNSEKVNLKKLKIFVYLFSFMLIIINEFILGISGNQQIYSFFYLIFILTIFFIFSIILNKFIKNEAK